MLLYTSSLLDERLTMSLESLCLRHCREFVYETNDKSKISMKVTVIFWRVDGTSPNLEMKKKVVVTKAQKGGSSAMEKTMV